MIIEIILISIIIALIRKGKVNHIAKYDVKLKALFFAYLIVQLGLVFFGNKLPESIANYTMFIYLLSYLLLLGFLLRNIERPEIMILLVGVFLNFTVTFINGGKMPLSPDAAAMSGMAENGNVFLQKMSAISASMGASTKLKILGDIIPMPAFYPFSVAISVGDLIIFVGLFLAIQKMFVRGKTAENPFSTKKERQREEEFFSKDVKLVDISEFFSPEENPQQNFEEKSSVHETNAITRLIEEISEVKEPEAAEKTVSLQNNASPRKTPDRLPEQKKTTVQQPDGQIVADKAAAEVKKSETPVVPQAVETEKSIEAQKVQAAVVTPKPVTISDVEEAPVIVDENGKSEQPDTIAEIGPGEGVEIEPGQLTFLDDEMAMYIDLFKTNSPLKDYIKNMAQQPAPTEEQEEKPQPEEVPSQEILAKDGTENIMKQYFSPPVVQALPDEQVAAVEDVFEEEVAKTLTDDEPKEEDGASLSKTRQLSMQDLAKAGEEEREKSEEEELGQPAITRQINARPSTRAILRAIKGGEGFEYNEDKYTLTFKESEEVPLQERKEMFLQQLYEYDIDIRKTNAASNEEKEKIEMDIKRDQGINVDDMFIVEDGRFIANPNYKFRKKK